MKTKLIILFLMANSALFAQPLFEFSRNIYRSPYDNGTEYGVSQDDVTHSPLGAFDLRATGDDNCNTHRIVAAAAGTVRNVVENWNISGPGNSEYNNYVWIQHVNGEWTKYTHFKQNSVVVSVGDAVCAGDFLGYECSIGAVSPVDYRHLHFEVRAPVDPENPPISLAGGFMDGSEPRRIPVICDITNNYFTKNDVNTAANCSCSASQSFLILSVGNGEKEVSLRSNSISAGTAVTFSNGSNGFFRAGNNVTFTPGFTASAGTYFSATIGPCTTPGCQ